MKRNPRDKFPRAVDYSNRPPIGNLYEGRFISASICTEKQVRSYLQQMNFSLRRDQSGLFYISDQIDITNSISQKRFKTPQEALLATAEYADSYDLPRIVI